MALFPLRYALLQKLYWAIPCILGLCILSLVMENSLVKRTTSSQRNGDSSLRRPPRSRGLPSFGNGGVIIFFHVAKTGGTSIRENLDGLDSVQFEFVANVQRLQQVSLQADQILSRNQNNSSTILFLELHGDLPGLLHFQLQLKTWRSLAAAHGTAFFACTLVRDPVAHAASLFNFYHVPPCLFDAPLCVYPFLPSTDQSIVAAAKYNYQCLYLARDAWDSFPAANETAAAVQVTGQECLDVYQVMVSELDWIGTTENLSNETLPLLWYLITGEGLLGGKSQLGWKRGMEGTKPGALRPESLKPLTVQYLLDVSQYDKRIYDAVKSDFPITMWGDFL